ncbi:MAG TPA: ABC transporter ATP-binding protein [Devosia sp.]|nr:ABC transporter ATP-binding protein [Devosia sp.]
MVESSSAAIDSSDRPALEVRGLSKSFGDVKVLKDISMSMKRGEFLVLVGPSGCGKSTLLNCIAGLEEVTGGEILIYGRAVTQVPPRDRDIAMVFQSYALYPTMTVAENISFGMKVRRVSRERQHKKVGEVARVLQIERLLDRKPGQLSGGQRQRVAMGRALVRDPKLFLFDEPLSNLDAKLRVEMRGEIKSLHERLSASIVYVTHDQVEAMTLGTSIVVLKDGEVQQIGSPAHIYNRPANLFVADFMGSPPMNLVRGVLHIENGHAGIKIGTGTDAVNWVGEKPSDALCALDNSEIIIGVRPEAIDLADDKKPDFVLKVTKMEQTGSDVFATLEMGGQPVAARLPGHTEISLGDVLALRIDKRNVCYFDPETTLRIN